MKETLVENNENGERLHQSYLLRIFDHRQRYELSEKGMELTLNQTQNRLENNIETLDYLRGISCLENDFVDLAENVVKTSLHLSNDCKNINREALNSVQLAKEVDKAWEHIAHLGSVLQTHIKHAKRYHLFNLKIENLWLQLEDIVASVHDMHTDQLPTTATIDDISSKIHQTLELLTEAFVSWQALNQFKTIVCPLHHRLPLPSGVHSGVLLITISLPCINGKPGAILRAGTLVHVRASRPADLLHREWFLVDPTMDENHYGRIVASVPAAFVWLTSTEDLERRVGVYCEKDNQKSHTVTMTPQLKDSIEMVEDLRKYLFRVWEECCLKFDQILQRMCITILKDALANSQMTPLSKDEQRRFDKALEKMTELTKTVNSHPSLEQLIEEAKSRHQEQGHGANVDVGAADALVQAIETFREMISRSHTYGSQTISGGFQNEESGKSQPDTPEILGDTSLDSFKPPNLYPTPIHPQPIVCADPIITKVTHDSSSKTPDLVEFPSPASHKSRHKYWIDNADAGCPNSTNSSSENAGCSISLVSPSLKGDNLTESVVSPSRSRKRNRFHRFLPLLRRHKPNKEIIKVSKDGESENVANRISHVIPSTLPKTPPDSEDNFTLTRVNCLKNVDFARLQRARPSTLALNSLEESFTPIRTSTHFGHEPQHYGEPTSYPQVLYSNTCVNSRTTEMRAEEKEKHSTNRSSKVGKSFTEGAKNTEGELPTDGRDQSPIKPNPNMGTQVDLPNRLRGLRCHLEFEQPGVELGDRHDFSCNGECDEQCIKNVKGEKSYKALSFRVAFNNNPASCISTN